MIEMSLARFIERVAVMEAEADHAIRKALDRAAAVVEVEAKAEIGQYQDGAGPFVAWAPLAPSTLADKEAKGYAPPDNPLLREGDMRDSIGRQVDGHEAVVGSDSDIAVWQEMGTERIPARSFLGGAAFRKSEKVAEICGDTVVKTLISDQATRLLIP